jgi:hypothetical protein
MPRESRSAILSILVLWTVGISLLRANANFPRELWQAIIATAILGALVLIRTIW